MLEPDSFSEDLNWAGTRTTRFGGKVPAFSRPGAEPVLRLGGGQA
ncbi:hypothetical protein ACFT8P_35215 [Streptomyces sp. NPDC057101]